MSSTVSDCLLNFLLPVARELLCKTGSVGATAVHMNATGELAPLAIHIKGDAAQMVSTSLQMLRDLSKLQELQGVAICYDGRVTAPDGQKQTAIVIYLEERDGTAKTLYMPFTKRLLRGYRFEKLKSVDVEPKIFT